MKAIVDEKRAWLSLGVKVIAIVFILWLLFGILFGAHRVIGISMTPYIADGDLLFYSRMDRSFTTDDVVLYRKDGKNYIARIVALPNESVHATEEGYIYVNSEQASDDPVCNDKIEIAQVNSAINKPMLGYFLLNDNSDVAEDSRSFGRIEEKDIYGKVLTVIRTRRP